MRIDHRSGALLALCIVVSSCSWFRHKDESAKPAELKSIKQEVHLVRVWKRGVGDEARDRDSKLVPVLAGGRVFAASADGTIMALQPESGKVIWKKRVEDYYPKVERAVAFAAKSDAITGGVGAGKDIIVVGTFAGDIVAINQSDGSLAWRSRTTSEVLAPPQVQGDLAVAQSIDGKVEGYNALDGTRLWVYTTTIPSLTLRGTSTPIMGNTFVVAGFSNGRVAVIDSQRGLARVDQRIAIAQGKSDLDRLVDIDGRMVIDNGALFAVSYQGNVAAIDLEQGRILWSKPASSVAGLAAGFNNIYMASFDGKLSALSERSGQVMWETDALKNRELTTPATISSYVVVGDFEGYIHAIAQSDGRFVGRTRVEHGPLTSPIVVDGARLYVQTRDGRLFAYELR